LFQSNRFDVKLKCMKIMGGKNDQDILLSSLANFMQEILFQ